MINRIISFSLHARLGIALFLIGLTGAGVLALNHIAIDALPDVTNNQVQIITEAKGYSPLEVERLVTYPLEQSLFGLPKTQQIRSISKFGLSVITVVFEDDMDLYFARQVLSEKLQSSRSFLPATVQDPSLGPMSSALGEIYQYEVKGKGYSLTELRTFHDLSIKPRLKAIDGVAEVNSFGGFVLQYHVELTPSRLSAYGVTVTEVYDAIARNNRIATGNIIRRGEEQLIIRGLGFIEDVEDLSKISVASNANIPITLKDLGIIRLGHELRHGAVTRDGKGEVVSGIIMMRRGENSRKVISDIENAVAAINQSLSHQGIEVDSFYDQTDLIYATLKTIITNLLEAGLLVVLVLVLMMGSLPAAIIVACVIPLSMLFTFIGMNGLGLSVNLMSLGALDFGMIVDGPVVLVETTIAQLAGHSRRERVDILSNALPELARPIGFGVLIILAVYFPILTLEGIEAKLFVPMAIAVCCAVLGSLILSFTYIPFMLSAIPISHAKEPRSITWLRDRYKKTLQRLIGYPVQMMSVLGVILIAAFFGFRSLGGDFITELDEGQLLVEVKHLPSISLEESVRLSLLIEAKIKTMPEVKTVVSKTGRPDIASDYMGVYETDVFVILYPKDEWTRPVTKHDLQLEIEEKIRPVLGGAAIHYTQPIQMRVNELISGAKGDLAIKLFGENMDTLQRIAETVAFLAERSAATASIVIEPIEGQPYLHIEINRDEIARFGVSIDEVQDIIETAIGGKVATEVIRGRQRIGVTVRFQESERNSLEAIGNILIPLKDERRGLPLKQLARLYEVEGPVQLSHENGERRLVLSCSIEGGNLAGYVSSLRQLIESKVYLGSGYFIEYGGQFENQERASARLAIVLPMTLALIFTLLWLTFKRLWLVLLVMAVLPFATVGGIVALLLREMSLTVTAMIGFIALFGVAILNGIVMISRLVAIDDSASLKERWEDRAHHLDDAIFEAASLRLRPVLMTALVAGIGFLPMAFSEGVGAEVQRPLATVVIAGVVSSSLLTLFVLPILYLKISQMRIAKLPP